MSSSISAALSAFQLAPKTLHPPATDDASDSTLEDTDMAVPRRKTSPSRRGMRRSADALKMPAYAGDTVSGELRPHPHLHLKTGVYRGRQVLKAKKESGSRRGSPAADCGERDGRGKFGKSILC